MEYEVKLKEANTVFLALRDRISRYKYPIAVLLLGIFLMLMPEKHQVKATTEPCSDQAVAIDSQLKLLLQQINGAGRVEVLLTIEQGASNTYQTDLQVKVQSENEEREAKTVLISDADGIDRPILISSNSPQYRGAVVVCDGADSPTVKLNIVRAISSVTGLGSDKISVIKMRSN